MNHFNFKNYLSDANEDLHCIYFEKFLKSDPYLSKNRSCWANMKATWAVIVGLLLRLTINISSTIVHITADCATLFRFICATFLKLCYKPVLFLCVLWTQNCRKDIVFTWRNLIFWFWFLVSDFLFEFALIVASVALKLQIFLCQLTYLR